jgi:hypothetical protein
LFWNHSSLWKLQPKIVMQSKSNITIHANALYSHLADLRDHYVFVPKHGQDKHNSIPDIVIVNLIDKHGTQSSLGKWLLLALKRLENKVFSLPVCNISESYNTSGGLTVEPVTSSDFIITMSDAADNQRSTVANGRRGLNRLKFKKTIENKSMSFPLVTRTMSSDVLLVRHMWYDFNARNKLARQLSNNLDEIVNPLRMAIGLSVKDNYTNSSSLNAFQDSGAYFAVYNSGDDNKRLIQQRIVRTNCVDCLDRTNVMQVVTACMNYVHSTNNNA